MKTTLSLLIFCVLPGLALASIAPANGPVMPHMPEMAGMPRSSVDSIGGHAGKPTKVERTVEVSMDDTLRFTPDNIQVHAGETIRFSVKNVGKLPHEMVIGSMAELKEHADMMRRMPGMKQTEPNVLALAPGQHGDLLWQFGTAGIVDFACLVPGHMEAGMSGKIEVK